MKEDSFERLRTRCICTALSGFRAFDGVMVRVAWLYHGWEALMVEDG
ncbi:hypothetical protein [Vulcanisaeta distributa]|nr:hypothetical protein [Vulcanisaeta distributa]